MKYGVERTIVFGSAHGMKFHTHYNSLFAILRDFRPNTVVTKLYKVNY